MKKYQVLYHQVEVIHLRTSNIPHIKENNLKKKTVILMPRMPSVIYKVFKETLQLMTTMNTIDLKLTLYPSLNHDLTTTN